MSDIILISGSPSERSRSNALLSLAARYLNELGLATTTLSIRDYPAADLILGQYDSPAFDTTKQLIAEASGLVVATPVYKAAYTGSLKTLLDILPQGALRNKTVLPLATGGSLAHLLVLDYALKPVLGSLGASDILQGVYATDAELPIEADGSVAPVAAIRERLEGELRRLADKVRIPALA